MAGVMLSTTGLLMATATSVTNVLTDVSRKKILDRHEVIATSFWCKIVATLVYGTVILCRIATGSLPEIRDSGALFGFESLYFSPLVTFLIYLLIDTSLVACATFLYFRALQVSPLSLCLPFIAFTPVFLIPTGYILLRELPSWVKIIGVLLVVVGSLMMHRELFAVSLFEPFKAIVRERGSRYMLLVALIFSITNPIDAKLVRMSDPFTQAFAYGVALCIFYGGLTFTRGSDWRGVGRAMPGWILLAGVLEAIVLLLQFSSHLYIDVAVTISIKRAGIVLAVLMGWLIFKERGITDKLIASSVMLSGALMFYLPMTIEQSLAVAATVMVGMAIALRYTTRWRSVAAVDLTAATTPRAEGKPVETPAIKAHL